jgi:hypothetical protein
MENQVHHPRPTKRKNWFSRHKTATVVGIVVLLVVVASAAGGNKPSTNQATTKSAASTEDTSTQTKPTAAKIGQTVADGKFEFVVSDLKCGIPSVSDSSGYITKTAQGQYCFLTLSVKNIGNTRQVFLEDDQKLLNANGQQYSPDTTATLYNSNNADVFVSEINPGNSVSGTLVYDIPSTETPVTAELHDSAYSNGTKVTLQ